MKKGVWTGFFIFVAILIGFNAGYVLGQSPWAPFYAFGVGGASRADSEATRPFWEVWDLVNARYYQQPLDTDVMMQGAIDGMLATLEDENTRYLPPQEESQSQEQMDGEFQGIGVVVEAIDGAITVVSPIEGSPAEAAGLRPGDILRQADGIDLTGMDLSEAATIIRGPAGTAVSLVIERGEEALSLEIVRDTIVVPSVRGEVLEGDIGYIRINQFIRTTKDDLAVLLEELPAGEMSGLVLDLRRNPGGLLDQVHLVADQFLPEGVVLIEEFGGERRRVFESGGTGLAEDVPLVVLIDEGSASASEVLAGAIQDRERGVLIGVPSFGKGTVQSVNGLSNGGGLRLTIARWLTPDERWVHREGLDPDLLVVLPEIAPGETPPEVDAQLQAALDYLRGRPVAESDPSELELSVEQATEAGPGESSP